MFCPSGFGIGQFGMCKWNSSVLLFEDGYKFVFDGKL
jgi:hypothetical protein